MKRTKTMKRLLMLAGMAVLTVTLAACGSHSAKTTSTTATRTVTTSGGSVKVPVHPKRIVTNVYTGDVLSLGGHVVGATSTDLQSPYLSKKDEAGIKDLGLTLKQEAVLKLKPDLIVTSNEADVKALKKIAPVVYVAYGSTGDIKQTATKFGNLINRKAQATDWIKRFDQQAKTQASRLTKAGIDPKKTSVGLFDLQNGKLFVDGAKWGRGGQALTTGLGFSLPAAFETLDQGAGYKQISLESVNKYAADWLFFSQTTGTSQDKSALSDLKRDPYWRKLAAVKANHVVQLPFNKMYYFDPDAVYGQMKLIVDAMIKAK
ncbi:ABC transporter substrate-binding protein [Secundilactobacillus kimchicus]|uniref:ABC transporter substrate-binding protein n=1 Tax=Secundilactobacillus kimchicus TaxID=528209 RepID=UPI0006E27948|nr:ABC transporter substrate-binding protein [Secundilactobacillus kimchicus]